MLDFGWEWKQEILIVLFTAPWLNCKVGLFLPNQLPCSSVCKFSYGVLWCTFKWETFWFHLFFLTCFVWFCFPLNCFYTGFFIEGIVTLYLCNGIPVNSTFYICSCQTARPRWSSIISQQTACTAVSCLFCFLLVFFFHWENEILFLSTPNNSALAAPTQYSAKWLSFPLNTSRTFILDENSWIYVTVKSIIDHQASCRSVDTILFKF